MIVKPLAEEVVLSASETDVDLASVVRVVNTTNTAATITIKDGSNTVASLTLTGGEVLNIQKTPSHTLIATGTVKAVKIAHTN
jgi:hypothetical protein